MLYCINYLLLLGSPVLKIMNKLNKILWLVKTLGLDISIEILVMRGGGGGAGTSSSWLSLSCRDLDDEWRSLLLEWWPAGKL